MLLFGLPSILEFKMAAIRLIDFFSSFYPLRLYAYDTLNRANFIL